MDCCYGCNDRYLKIDEKGNIDVCHSSCSDYIAARTKLDEINKKRRLENESIIYLKKKHLRSLKKARSDAKIKNKFY